MKICQCGGAIAQYALTKNRESWSCHANLDQGRMSKDEKSQMWHNAHVKTKGMLDK